MPLTEHQTVSKCIIEDESTVCILSWLLANREEDKSNNTFVRTITWNEFCKMLEDVEAKIQQLLAMDQSPLHPQPTTNRGVLGSFKPLSNHFCQATIIITGDQPVYENFNEHQKELSQKGMET